MPDALPVLSGDPDVLLAAIAKAAAMLAAQKTGRRTAPPYENDVEEIAKRSVREAFARFGVYLDKPESVDDFRDTLDHLRRSRKRWDKAAGAVVAAVMSSIGLGVMAAVGKYVLGGPK